VILAALAAAPVAAAKARHPSIFHSFAINVADEVREKHGCRVLDSNAPKLPCLYLTFTSWSIGPGQHAAEADVWIRFG
jgi:hypothetical protein